MIHNGATLLLGTFLIIMGLAMLLMCCIYYKTKKMNFAWLTFGIIYTMGLLFLMTDNPIKEYLKVPSQSSFYSPMSIIILIIGICLSFVVFTKKGEKYIIAGILLSVGVHFFPFNTVYTYVLGTAVILNSLYPLIKIKSSIYTTIIIDSFLKITMGLSIMFTMLT